MKSVQNTDFSRECTFVPHMQVTDNITFGERKLLKATTVRAIAAKYH